MAAKISDVLFKRTVYLGWAVVVSLLALAYWTALSEATGGQELLLELPLGVKVKGKGLAAILVGVAAAVYVVMFWGMLKVYGPHSERES